MEIWKDIQGFEGLYEVSNYGQVRSKTREVKRSDKKRGFYKSKTKALNKDNKGYLRVTICKDGTPKTFKVHRLVASNFIGNIEGFDINHIDGNKQNNLVSNLEICTTKQNCIHSLIIGTKGGVKLNENQVLEIRSSIKNPHELASIYMVHVSNIRAILKRKSWKHI